MFVHFHQKHATIFQSYLCWHRWAGRLKKLYLRSGSLRHWHFAGFFNVPILQRHWTTFVFVESETPPFKTRWGYGGRVLTGGLFWTIIRNVVGNRVCNDPYPCDVCRKWSKEKRSIMNKMMENKNAQITATSTWTWTSDAVNTSPADPIDGISGQSRKSPSGGSSVSTHSPCIDGGGDRVRRSGIEPLIRTVTGISNQQEIWRNV